MIMIVCMCSFLKSKSSTLETVHNHHLSPWHRNDIVFWQPLLPFSFFFTRWPYPTGWTSLPSSRSSRVPGIDPYVWGLVCTQVGLPNVHIHHFFLLFFTVLILALLFNHIFKFTFKYDQTSPFSQQTCLTQQSPFS